MAEGLATFSLFMGALLEEMENKLREVLQGLGLELVRTCRASSKKGSLLRIIIHKSGGVSISDCERATEASRRILEAQNESCARAGDPTEGGTARKYSKRDSAKGCGIEVSSPGLDEPLRSMRDFMRRQGEETTLYLLRPVSGRLQMEGKIAEATEEALILEVNGNRVSIPFQDISVGKLMIKI